MRLWPSFTSLCAAPLSCQALAQLNSYKCEIAHFLFLFEHLEEQQRPLTTCTIQCCLTIMSDCTECLCRECTRTRTLRRKVNLRTECMCDACKAIRAARKQLYILPEDDSIESEYIDAAVHMLRSAERAVRQKQGHVFVPCPQRDEDESREDSCSHAASRFMDSHNGGAGRRRTQWR